MKCSRCKKWIESYEIKFAREGEIGKPLCRKCKAEVEEESREKYRKRRAEGNGYSKMEQNTTSSYENKRYLKRSLSIRSLLFS